MSIVKIRQSQIVSTYGPGALVDLPDNAVLVAGLEHWAGNAQLVPEPRLYANLRRRLGLSFLELRSPPVPEREEDLGIGIVAWQFPEWFVAQFEVRTKEFGRSRPLVHRRALVKGRYVGQDTAEKRKRKHWPVVPIRFVQACPNGHVSDINWPRLIHGDGVACGGQLWLDERGTTGDLSELFVRCDGCNRPAVSLQRIQGSIDGRSELGECHGDRPWLGPMARETCADSDGKPHRNKLLIRHASNAYFPVVERAISIPDHDEVVRKAVDAVWDDFLSVAEGPADIKRERKKQRVQQALDGLSDDEVWAECERRQSGGGGFVKGLKEVELDSFLSVPDELGDDRPEGDFYARRLSLEASRKGPLARVARVVLVHRLREVVTQIGFTRFESPALPIDSEVDLGVRLAALALETRWLPAVENRGEGVFLSLDATRVKEWLTRPAVRQRAKAFHPGIQSTSKEPVMLERVEEIYMPYVMLHSLSHLLLTEISLECGYAAASIRERIYVRDGAYGLLLYTGTPDAEGTLGGLVQVGRRIGRHLEAALELGRLCSNDPVCAQHHPDRAHEDRPLHGAACHGCLLIAEPSCERRNELLDRSLVVPTVDLVGAAFFAEGS
ncbi:DrmB family protein [Sorangium sp. So ce341]|uniref:DrmB family protein n=1 Tax=Sorangium sp. So ce341 TaxID=3133302 RepID=UPI003F60D936